MFTDHKSLDQLNEQRLNTMWQQKVYSKLAGLQYKIVYKKGNENGEADALSRKHHDEASLMTIFQCTPAWLQDVIQGYQQDQHAKGLLTKLAIRSTKEISLSRMA